MNQTDWTEINNQLVKEFTFKDFTQAWGFMTKVAFVSEKMNHHPEWTNCWNRVTIKLSTHDAGDIITEKDRNLAQAIENLF
jgi:4a-hydroxytetrahydrobiopterin dehydratase